MNKEFEGYVIYCKDTDNRIPFGIVSEDYELRAITHYIPDCLKGFIVQVEDKRFFKHKGIDFRGISRAMVQNVKARKIVQGGSTITQQLARNLLKDNNRSISRKLREIILAIQIENKCSKDEILHLYFNNVYFGKNLRGIRAAGLYYFGKEVDKLNQSEFLYLLTILRGPNYYIKRPDIAVERYRFISDTLYKCKLISKSRNQKNLRTVFNLKDNQLQAVKSISIPFIIESKDNKQKKIMSTINPQIQLFAKQFVTDSKYPVSIIGLRQKKVICFASSYGTDYPFISRSNVGSTLKPFLYCYLRDNGISLIEKFNAYENEMSLNVREVRYYKHRLNIEEALFYSNNNSFLNAANKIGIQNSLQFLAKVCNRPESDFYPSSILGATRNGISIYELALAYSSFFFRDDLTENKIECLSILNQIFFEKLGFNIEDAFLKTGTTNNNKERFAVLGNAELTFAVLRNKNQLNDESKEGGFIKQISRSFSSFFKKNNSYVWI